MSQQKKLPQTPILFLLASFPTISALLATPSLPNMVQSLGITPSQAQSTITVFLLGYAFGNLPYGPLSKKYGRKPIIYLGALLAIFGALTIALTKIFSLILLGRLLMGLGSGVGLKMSYTIIGDVYEHKAATKVISILMYAFAIVPAVGMTLGGFLTETFGWQSCYFFLAAYSFFILALSSFLPETSGVLDPHALNISNIYQG
jgi:DHA1 family bicyclomycin/chloramphenicol resistance-like MFS transporter